MVEVLYKCTLFFHFMKSFKNIYFNLFAVTILIFLFFRLPYRDHIYHNNIFDFYIADTSPNFFAVFLLVFYRKWQNEELKNITLCVLTFIILCLYELFIQKYMSLATIDYRDLVASFIGTILAYFVIQKIDKMRLSKNIET